MNIIIIFIILAIASFFIAVIYSEKNNTQLFFYILLISFITLSITKPEDSSQIESPKIKEMNWGDVYINRRKKSMYNNCYFKYENELEINAICKHSNRLIINNTYKNVEILIIRKGKSKKIINNLFGNLFNDDNRILELKIDNEVIYSDKDNIYKYYINLVWVCASFMIVLYRLLKK